MQPEWYGRPTCERCLSTSTLVIARRWDVDVANNIDLSTDAQRKSVRNMTHEIGSLCPRQGGVDFFMFARGALPQLPVLVVGRAGWDGRLVYEALEQGLPVVDATGQLTVIHQNHDYSHVTGGHKEVFTNCDAKLNGQDQFNKLKFAEDAPFTIESLAWAFDTGQTVSAAHRRQPRLSLVTPIGQHSAGEIEATMKSVFRQGYMNLEYTLVGDGDSGVSLLIEQYRRYLTGWLRGREETAISQAFDRALGDIMGFVPVGSVPVSNIIHSVLQRFSSQDGPVLITAPPFRVMSKKSIFWRQELWAKESDNLLRACAALSKPHWLHFHTCLPLRYKLGLVRHKLLHRTKRAQEVGDKEDPVYCVIS